MHLSEHGLQLLPVLFAATSGGQLSRILESLERNLLTPIPLCFLLGIICTRIHGGIKIPKERYYSIAIFLLMSGGARTQKIEFVVSGEVAVDILSYVSHQYFEHYACIAWLSDVSVVRGDQYVKPGGR